MKPYVAAFEVGAEIEVVGSTALEQFMRTWHYHNPVQAEQLPYAGKSARVAKIGFYHGGDPLYELEGAPGIWHERCLTKPAG